MGFINNYKESIRFEKNAFSLLIKNGQFIFLLSIMIIIDLFQLSSLYSEIGDFEDGSFGINKVLHLPLVGVTFNIMKISNYNMRLIFWKSFLSIIKALLLLLLLFIPIYCIVSLFSYTKSLIILMIIGVILVPSIVTSSIFIDQIIYDIDSINPLVLLRGSIDVMRILYSKDQLHKLFLTNHISIIFLALIILTMYIKRHTSDIHISYLLDILNYFLIDLIISYNTLIRTALYDMAHTTSKSILIR